MWPPEEHERLIENMSAWMDGELPDIASTPEAGGPDDLELEVAEHQACCPSCRDLFEELKELRAGFETLPEPDPPEGFAQGVMDHIRAEEKPRVIPLLKRPQVRALAGLAACLVLAVGLYHTARFSQKDTGEDFDWMVQSFSKDASDAVSGDPDTPQIAAYAAPEAPAASGDAADGISPRKISPKYSVGGAAVSSGTPEECAFQNDQYLWMAYDGDTPEPEARIIGSAQSLADFLLQYGGSIGYSVRPSERRKGYAKETLRLTLVKCREAGEERVLITCDRDNPASARTILANGGVLENEVADEPGLGQSGVIQRYWITLSKS